MPHAATHSQSENLGRVVTNVTAVPSLCSIVEPSPETRLSEPRGQESPNQTPPGEELCPRDLPPDRVCFPSNTSSDDVSRRGRHEIWRPRQYYKWKSPLLMFVFFILGLGISIGHCAFYSALNNTIVGSQWQQENNLRIGTAFAFLSQITLSASVWQTYTQWIWRSVKKTAMTIATLNDVFGADTSVLSFLNLDMLRDFKVGYFIAVFAWTLVLPPFFTPGTLSVYQSTNQVVVEQTVPYLTIANSTEGHLYAYSPSDQGDRFNFKDVPARVFTGPRSILTLLSTATAAQGAILPIKAPYNHSSYSINFFGPAVQCRQADTAVESKINDLLKLKMDKPMRAANEVENAYYAFVPAFDSQGGVTALSEVRHQAPVNASNQLWMVFQRYVNVTGSACDYKQYHQVCKLWNATYNLHLSWENGFQNITGSRNFSHEVEYPNDKPQETSNMAQHAYSAFMWGLTDQVVGSLGWFNDTAASTTARNKTFGIISSPIQHNSLLGSSDLDVFFDFNEDIGACQIPYAKLSPQRQQDKDLAKNRMLGELIEEMSFNMTVSLMHNDLLTRNVTRIVNVWEDVNRYRYSPTGLFIPYALACLFSFVTVLMGATTYVKHGVLPDKKFQDILSAGEDPNAIQLAREPTSRRRSMTADFGGEHPTFRAATILTPLSNRPR